MQSAALPRRDRRQGGLARLVQHGAHRVVHFVDAFSLVVGREGEQGDLADLGAGAAIVENRFAAGNLQRHANAAQPHHVKVVAPIALIKDRLAGLTRTNASRGRRNSAHALRSSAESWSNKFDSRNTTSSE